MKKVFIMAGIICVAIIVGIFVINIYEADTKVTKESTRIGLVLNGEKKDGSWSQSHFDGLQKTAKKLNLEIICKEQVTHETVTATIDELVENGCKIIVVNSIEFEAGVASAAERYPEVYFYHATGTGEGKNLSSYFGRMYQVRYLCGIVAGLQTETNEIGYVATYPISEVNRGINAFTIGVRSVNPEATVYVCWTNSWTEKEATADATNRLLDTHNIDLITMHTDSLEPLEIAQKRGIMAIGYNVDNSKRYPDTLFTSAVWDWKKFYTQKILRCLQGKFEGEHYWEGIESGIVSLAPFTNKVRLEVYEAVAKEKERLCSGTYDVFYGPLKDQNGNVRVAEGESMTDDVMLNEFDWYVEGVVTDEE